MNIPRGQQQSPERHYGHQIRKVDGRANEDSTRFPIPISTILIGQQVWLGSISVCFSPASHKDCTTPTAPNSAMAEMAEAPPTSTMQLETGPGHFSLTIEIPPTAFKTLPYRCVGVSFPRVYTCKPRVIACRIEVASSAPHFAHLKRILPTGSNMVPIESHSVSPYLTSGSIPLPRLSRLSRFPLRSLSWCAHFSPITRVPTWPPRYLTRYFPYRALRSLFTR